MAEAATITANATTIAARVERFENRLMIRPNIIHLRSRPLSLQQPCPPTSLNSDARVGGIGLPHRVSGLGRGIYGTA